MTDSLDHIIQRVVDRRASVRDWDEFTARAALRPELQVELVDRMREDDLLREAFEPIAAIGDRIELPRTRATAATRATPFVTGFAAAMLLCMLAWGLLPQSTRVSRATTSEPTTSAPTPTHAEALIMQYLDAGRESGRVVRELPRLALGVRRNTENTDGLEVLYVRRFLECGPIESTIRLASDEHGDAVTIPITNLSNAFARDL